MPNINDMLRGVGATRTENLYEGLLSEEQFIICDHIGFISLPYAHHALVYGVLLAYREGYSSVSDLATDKPYLLAGNRLDEYHSAMDYYLKHYGSCYKTQCSDKLVAWSDTSLNINTEWYLRERGYKFVYVGGNL